MLWFRKKKKVQVRSGTVIISGQRNSNVCVGGTQIGATVYNNGHKTRKGKKRGGR